MKLSDFDYKFPKELIAIEPTKPRDHSRLLVLEKDTCKIEHKHFYDIVDYLQKEDVLVLNNSKVFPARLIGKKKESGGKVEVFLLKEIKNSIWECLIGGLRGKEDIKIDFDMNLNAKILKNNNDGTWEVKFNKSGDEFMKLINEVGRVPLPPYIKKRLKASDRVNYQTVYADDKKVGSVAAPTAGFHFTPRLLKKIKQKGIQIEYITLHVGLGTFAPVKIENIKKHKMHSEYVEIRSSVIKNVKKAKKEKRRVVAVGTTSVRSLEALARSASWKDDKKFSQLVDIFIYPGFKFKVVDSIITNFHLPKSTLLMLASAFARKSSINEAYKQAIKRKYRFYSYGDSMFIY